MIKPENPRKVLKNWENRVPALLKGGFWLTSSWPCLSISLLLGLPEFRLKPIAPIDPLDSVVRMDKVDVISETNLLNNEHDTFTLKLYPPFLPSICRTSVSAPVRPNLYD